MTFDEFKNVVMPLSVALGAAYDLPTWRLYYRALETVPMPLLMAAVQKAAETRTKMPTAAQIRELAEVERKGILAAHPYDGCIDCEHQKGWVPVTVDGVQRVKRCACAHRYAEMLGRLGVGLQPLALPAGRDDEAA